jgi:hypothetical protein
MTWLKLLLLSLRLLLSGAVAAALVVLGLITLARFLLNDDEENRDLTQAQESGG